MTLDFTNYTFSGLISLLAAILGIGYPLFLESIRKIDEQYDSTRLSARFQRERNFHWYRHSLLASIAVCFCVPFIMLLFPIHTVSLVAIAIQALCVLWLIIEMLGVFQMVQEYYNPNKLFYRIHIPEEYKEADTQRREELLCLVDLARYACRRNNSDVYNLSKSQLVHLIHLEESKAGNTKYNVSPDLYWALRQIADYSKDNKIRYLYNDNIAAQSFYNSFFEYTIGPKTYESLWTSACFVAEGGSDEWFSQQWSNANQYFTYRYELNPNRDEDDSELFREHHYMLGVMALFYQRYDWLRIVLFHTHSSPAKYPLVPSTYGAIIYAIKRLEAQRMNVWQLTQKYQMNGLFADVNSDDKLLVYAYRYAALLLIRLFSVNDYNITYSDPMQLPYLNPKASFYEMKKELELIEMLRWHVATWYKDDNLLRKVDLPFYPQQKEVETLLDQYKASVESQWQYKETHPTLDKNKMEELKPLLVEVDNRVKPLYPIHTEDEYDDKPIMIDIAERLDNQMSAEGGYRNWSNWPDVMVASLNHKIEAFYDGLLVYVNCDIYTINERNVFKALELLKPGKDDVIMSMGIYLPQIDMIYFVNPKLKYNGIYDCYYNETEVLSRPSNQSSIIVIRRDQLPSIGFLSPSEKMTALSMAELQDSQYHLCSNVDQVIAEGKPQPVVRLAKNIRGHIPVTAKGIRLVVKKNVDDTAEMVRLKSKMSKV